MTFRLDGKVAIVTGAGSGNGRAIANGLAAAGAMVCVADVVLDVAQQTVDAIRAADGKAIAVQANVTDRASIDRMVEATVYEFGRLDTLVNNAGVTNRDAFVDVPESEFDRVIGVNLKGPFLCAQAAVPNMRAVGGGSIINIVSTSAELVPSNLSVYATSKGGLKVLTRAMAVELGPYNIRANGICPGVTPTGLNADRLSRPGVVERELSRIPLGRIGRPDDYAGACVMLASDEVPWMTGAMLWIDGGFLCFG